MLAWFGRAQGLAEPPAWLVRLQGTARERPEAAVEQLRAAWQDDHAWETHA